MLKNAIRSMILLVLLVGLAGMIAAHDDGDPDDPQGDGHVNVDDYTFDEQLTYYADIAPIIEANCMACHTEGQIAGDLELYDPIVIRDNADYIADLANHRYMPPWMPGPETDLALENPRVLADEDIAKLLVWAQTGAAMGEEANAQTVSEGYALPEIRQDRAFYLEAPYQPAEGVDDDYRCFIFDPGFTEPTYVTGYVFEPDVMTMAHHGIIYMSADASRRQAESLDRRDEGPGWSCYNTTGLFDEEMLGTWTPGTFPVQYPEGTGYLVEPGDFFVMQMHYNTRIERVDDYSGFYIETEPGDADIRSLITVQLVAPVEIPCPVGVESEQCERDYAIEYAAERYGQEFARRPNELLAGCDQTLADYSDQDPANATTFCEFAIPFRLEAVGVYGHMHELGKRIRIEVNAAEDDNVVMLDVPRWDFHWQDRYQFVDPFVINPGDTLRMTCTWDNTLSDDPRYVVWGEGTEDEMCFGTIMVIDPR